VWVLQNVTVNTITQYCDVQSCSPRAVQASTQRCTDNKYIVAFTEEIPILLPLPFGSDSNSSEDTQEAQTKHCILKCPTEERWAEKLSN